MVNDVDFDKEVNHFLPPLVSVIGMNKKAHLT